MTQVNAAQGAATGLVAKRNDRQVGSDAVPLEKVSGLALGGAAAETMHDEGSMTGFEDADPATTESGWSEAVHVFPGSTTARRQPSSPPPAPDRPDIVSLPLVRAYRELDERIRAAFRDGLEGVPARVSVPVDGVDPLAWLAAQRGAPALYWRDRDGGRRVAGLGAADRLEPTAPDAIASLIDQAARRLRRAPGSLRYYGGMRFDPGGPIDGVWRRFGLGMLVLPRFELIECTGETRLACTLTPGRDDARTVLEALAALSPCPHKPASPTKAQRIDDTPDATGWASAVRGVIRRLSGRDGTRKVVLARRTTVHAKGGLDPLGLLAALVEQTPTCFHFFFSPDGETAFVGATPEQLFHRDGRTVQSEALAGTRPRGLDGAEDARFEAELRASAKDGREHGFVENHVLNALGDLTRGVECESSVSVLKLASVQHLLRRMRGILRRGCGDSALLSALHPTPAVCGEPPAMAVEQIRAAEGFDRGWYAGPVGFVGRDETRMAVGIRSALVHGDTAWLYAGAGVVKGSRADAEWQELEAKLGGIWPSRLS